MTERVRVPDLGLPPASADRLVHVAGDRGHHLARVVRVAPGDRVVLFDGEGHECDATVTAVTGGAVTLAAGVLRAGVGPDAAWVTWLQGVPKGDKLETVVRQATELGVRALWPVYTHRSVPQPRGERAGARTERLRRVAEEAARQCGRADLPLVADPMGLDAALEAITREAATALRIVAWERATTPLPAVVTAAPPGPCAVLAGPEGGLAEDEVARAAAHGFVPVSLGRRVLRAETVAPAVLAALAVLRGDLRGDPPRGR